MKTVRAWRVRLWEKNSQISCVRPFAELVTLIGRLASQSPPVCADCDISAQSHRSRHVCKIPRFDATACAAKIRALDVGCEGPESRNAQRATGSSERAQHESKLGSFTCRRLSRADPIRRGSRLLLEPAMISKFG